MALAVANAYWESGIIRAASIKTYIFCMDIATVVAVSGMVFECGYV